MPATSSAAQKGARVPCAVRTGHCVFRRPSGGQVMAGRRRGVVGRVGRGAVEALKAASQSPQGQGVDVPAAAGLTGCHRPVQRLFLSERRRALGHGRVAQSLHRRIATGPRLRPGLRFMDLRARRVASPAGTDPRSNSGSSPALRGIRTASPRRRPFRVRGITGSTGRGDGPGGTGSGGQADAAGAGRSGGAGMTTTQASSNGDGGGQCCAPPRCLRGGARGVSGGQAARPVLDSRFSRRGPGGPTGHRLPKSNSSPVLAS